MDVQVAPTCHQSLLKEPTPAPMRRATPIGGVQVALDVEQLLYDATRLLDAATLIKRLAKED